MSPGETRCNALRCPGQEELCRVLSGGVRVLRRLVSVKRRCVTSGVVPRKKQTKGKKKFVKSLILNYEWSNL
jgi:hypothetical protein